MLLRVLASATRSHDARPDLPRWFKNLNLNSPSIRTRISGILMRKIGSLVALIAILSVGSAHAAEISGIPEIADGDTVVISGIRLRLLDMDAPESDQFCLDKNGEPWSCGIDARDALKKKPVRKSGSVKPLAPTIMDECSPPVSSKRRTSVSGWFVRDGRCRLPIKVIATVLMSTSKPHAQSRPVFGQERSLPLGIGGGAIAKPRFVVRSAFR
jgi:endonuclease YncB( thermonuclease family)